MTEFTLVFLPKILQRGMAQILLAAEMLHAADQPRLDPLRRRPFHPVWRRRRMLLYALPAAFPHLPVQGDKGAPDIASGDGFPQGSEVRQASLVQYDDLTVDDGAFHVQFSGSLCEGDADGETVRRRHDHDD